MCTPVAVGRVSFALVLAGLCVGCQKGPTSPSRSATLAPPVPAPGPAPDPAGPHTLSGTVFETTAGGTRGLAGWHLSLQVEYSPRPRVFSGFRQDVTTDAQGRYEIAGLPLSLVWIHAAYSPATRGAEESPHVQPCAAAVSVERDTVFDVEVTSRHDPQPPTVVRPFTLSGVVFEQTQGGRAPVQGARVFVEKVLDFVPTGAVTDAQGRYLLCGLPADHWTPFAGADGYQLWVGDSFPLGSNRSLDIELRRR